jgi:hypothetical protein
MSEVWNLIKKLKQEFDRLNKFDKKYSKEEVKSIVNKYIDDLWK